MERRFTQVDVFGARPLTGNPLAVVHFAEDLTSAAMGAFANWTNLSETTFLLPPTLPEADYRVRIFTPTAELPFAGHPTLGSAHAWLEAGGVPSRDGLVVQECGAGLVPVRIDGARPAFAAPPLVRSGPLDASTMEQVLAALRVSAAQVLDAEWVDNGAGFLGVHLVDAETVLALKPDFHAFGELEIGVIGAYDAEARDRVGADAEVRAFVPSFNIPEDPCTGSLNAGLAQWLIGSGAMPSSYVVSQGTLMGRSGRIHISSDDGDIWVGGATATIISGTVIL